MRLKTATVLLVVALTLGVPALGVAARLAGPSAPTLRREAVVSVVSRGYRVESI
jgi:hypothetical protein